jgi:UDP-N-acetylglucosamine 4,6-dehydratase
LHEVLVSEDEARNAVELPDMYVIQPTHSWWRTENWDGGRPLPEGFRYTSDCNPHWLTSEELHELVDAASAGSEKLRVVEPKRAWA